MNLTFATLYVGVLKHFKACVGVRNDFMNNVGVKTDPRTCLTLIFLGPVSKVNEFSYLFLGIHRNRLLDKRGVPDEIWPACIRL